MKNNDLLKRMATPLFDLIIENFVLAKRNYNTINTFINHLNPQKDNYWHGEDYDRSLNIAFSYLEIEDEGLINKLSDLAYGAPMTPNGIFFIKDQWKILIKATIQQKTFDA